MDDNKTKVGIFLCEDNLITRNLIFKLLSEQGHEGVIINKEEDIKGHDYDAVILDEFARHLGSNEAHLIKAISEDAGISLSQAYDSFKCFKQCISAKDLEPNTKDVTLLEPLWVQQQRNKNFKRGKN